jgi:tetratricopeptide (TPR) repeat protein
MLIWQENVLVVEKTFCVSKLWQLLYLHRMRCFFCEKLRLIATCVLLFCVTAQAQEMTKLADVIEGSSKLMREKKWEYAFVKLQQATIDHQQNARQLFGSQFGVVWYQKGVCESQLNRHEEAMKSFEICYRDFPPETKEKGNLFHKMSLLKWAESAQRLGKFELAAQQYKKFLTERSKEKGQDIFQQGDFYVNISLCYFALEDLLKGMENLEIAFKNKDFFPTYYEKIMMGFDAFVATAITKQEEQAILDFIKKNRADIITDPFVMGEYGQRFVKLANDCNTALMPKAAMAIYQLIPHGVEVLEDIRAKQKILGAAAEIVDGSRIINAEKLKLLEESLVKEGDEFASSDVFRLLAVAELHEKNGNSRGALTAYESLVMYHPNQPKHEIVFYELISLALKVGDFAMFEKYSIQFLEKYPNSERYGVVQRLILRSLFDQNEYKKCVDFVSKLMNEESTNKVSRDVCLYYLATSFYYENNFAEAEKRLNEHVTNFPDSEFRQSILYYAASNSANLKDYDRAITKIDEFIRTYPEYEKNLFLPFAIFNLANCFYAKKDYAKSLENLNSIIDTYSTHELIASALLLRGKNFVQLANVTQAEVDLRKSYELATQKKDEKLAAETVFNLIHVLSLGSNESIPAANDVIKWVDLFWARYADNSEYRSKIAVISVPVMNAVGRSAEALKHLKEIIKSMNDFVMDADSESVVNAYSVAHAKKYSPAKLEIDFNELCELQSKLDQKKRNALLKIEVINVFEKNEKLIADPKTKEDLQVVIKNLYQKVREDFLIADLSSRALVKIGDFIRVETSAPREAISFYDEVITRGDADLKISAMFGRADVMAVTNIEKEITSALNDLTEIFQQSSDEIIREKSLRRKIRLLVKKEMWEEVNQSAKLYFTEKNEIFSSESIKLLLALSDEKLGRKSEAMITYSLIVGNVKSEQIHYAAQACHYLMKLLIEKNQAGDLQRAYDTGHDFLEKTKTAMSSLSPEKKDIFVAIDQLLEQLEIEPEVKAVKSVKNNLIEEDE